jgi:poly(A) polymerase
MKLFLPFLKKKQITIVPQNKHAMSRNLIERSVLDIMGRLRRSGFQVYLVGGCVRDILLGKKPKDFDIVTNARPQQIKRLFRRCFLIGRRFRLAHVYISHDRFVEVATFRAAVDPEQAAGEGRFAANNVYGTIEEDALRRDFTVNGLYYNSADGSIVDYGGGLDDLKKKTIRSVGDPMVRYREDPVRIIRAARFCAQIGFSPEISNPHPLDSGDRSA